MEINQWLNTELGKDIWKNKYQNNNEDFESWLDRVSNGNDEVRKLIKDKKFLFGGRILSNRGLNKNGRKVSLSNCYVISPPEDNIESIFDCAKKLARTFSYGGGCGIDISKLSPVGAKINNAAKNTTGSISFMDLYSLVTELIGQSGRRGALMISIDCDHPDLEDFINIKSDLNKVTKANISVKITDDFMKAVKNDDMWELKYKREETEEVISKIVLAKDLFRQLSKMNWDYAEPGCLFWDRINNWNLLSEDENFQYAGVNPCAEEPLPAGGSCLLGSLNLSEFIKKDTFDFNEFRKAIEIAVGGLNEVLHEGLLLHPLQEQKDSVNNWRQIGLGIFGLHDMLIKLKIRYGSGESFDLCNEIAKVLIDKSIEASANLTDVYGSYPMYNYETISNSQFFINNTSESTKKLVKEKGLANSQLLTIAPTGSIGTMLGVSTGIETIYQFSYTRKTESLHDKEEYYKVYTPIAREYMEQNNITDENDLPDFFNSAMTIDYNERLKMQSIWQERIDASISSTVNVPNDFTIEETEKLYAKAYELGLKGVTIYRSGCKREGILTLDTKEDSEIKMSEKNSFPWGTTIESSDDLIGLKRKIVNGCGSLHVQAYFDSIDGSLAEVFLSKGGSGGCFGYMNSLSRVMSAGLRTGLDFDYLLDQLQSVPSCPAYVARSISKRDTSKGSSCPSAIGFALLDMHNEIKNHYICEDEKVENVTELYVNNKNKCPECGEDLVSEGGCSQCKTCGWSKCD